MDANLTKTTADADEMHRKYMMCSWMFAPLVCFYSWKAVIDRENVFSWVVLAIVYLLSLFAFRELMKNPAKQLF